MSRSKQLSLRGVAGMLVALAVVPALAADTGLVRVRSSGFHEAYAAGGTMPTGFKSVFVAPVGAIAGDPRLDKLGARDIKTMEDFFGDKLKEKLSARFMLANAPGPGILVVESAFTTLQSNRLTLDQAKANPDLDVARTTGVGRAAISITLKDGGSGMVLATLADDETGSPIDHNANVNTVWGDAMAFSERWAQDLADLLSGR